MNREIKFRAWSKFDNGHMHRWNDGFNYRWFDRGGDKYVVLMQYTGLKDKNGVEIYEGDVCEFPYMQTDGSTEQEIDAISFADGQFVLFKWPLKDWNTRCAVIGNIYENPELLKAA